MLKARPHWDLKHSDIQKEKWKLSRSSIYFIYDISNKQLVAENLIGSIGVTEFFGYTGFLFNERSTVTKRQVSAAFNTGSVIYEKFIISNKMLNIEELDSRLNLMAKLSGKTWTLNPLYVYDEKGEILLKKFETVNEYLAQFGPLLVTLKKLILYSQSYKGFLFKVEPIYVADKASTVGPAHNTSDSRSNNNFVGLPKTKLRSRSTIYGFNPDTKEYRNWPVREPV